MAFLLLSFNNKTSGRNKWTKEQTNQQSNTETTTKHNVLVQALCELFWLKQFASFKSVENVCLYRNRKIVGSPYRNCNKNKKCIKVNNITKRFLINCYFANTKKTTTTKTTSRTINKNKKNYAVNTTKHRNKHNAGHLY